MQLLITIFVCQWWQTQTHKHTNKMMLKKTQWSVVMSQLFTLIACDVDANTPKGTRYSFHQIMANFFLFFYEKKAQKCDKVEEDCNYSWLECIGCWPLVLVNFQFHFVSQKTSFSFVFFLFPEQQHPVQGQDKMLLSDFLLISWLLFVCCFSLHFSSLRLNISN